MASILWLIVVSTTLSGMKYGKNLMSDSVSTTLSGLRTNICDEQDMEEKN